MSHLAPSLALAAVAAAASFAAAGAAAEAVPSPRPVTSAAPAPTVAAADLPGSGWTRSPDVVPAGFPAQLQACVGTRPVERRLRWSAGPSFARQSGSASQVVLSRTAPLPARASRALSTAYAGRLRTCVREVLLPAVARSASFDTAAAVVRAVPVPAGAGWSAAAAQLRLPLAGDYDGAVVVQVAFVTGRTRATGVAVTGSAGLSTAALRRVVARVGARLAAAQE
ncbi:hypothetical protein CLV35_1756 [Motilibacter peucedani]|uniref:PknH-like protein n=1 Tax=Motilibacter peucedani TaxID=598650 RepID=A0A420XPW3_9ACTN|nr:hypothetical protein [Motilibacter peucedani]RKS75297.1 hypothetical protein CLV35_1756 [Motilibacter peucedani]